MSVGIEGHGDCHGTQVGADVIAGIMALKMAMALNRDNFMAVVVWEGSYVFVTYQRFVYLKW